MAIRNQCQLGINDVSMNNLFVCHTQAQLLLAVSLSKGRFVNNRNYLILFPDFNITVDLKKVLENIFYKTLYRKGTYPIANKSWKAKIQRYPNDLKVIKAFMDCPYSRVFESCDDCIPELYILKYAHKLNKYTKYIWLEDGSYPYFRNTYNVSGFSSNKLMRFIRKCLLKYLCQLGKFYDFRGEYMGSNSILETIYLTFPGKQRKEYDEKVVIGITDDEYKNGLTYMFPPQKELKIDRKSVLFVLDKLDVYVDLSEVDAIIAQIVKLIIEQGFKIYYKYHPREDSQLKSLSIFTELNKNIGIEAYYSSSLSEHLIVIGIKSTGLQNAIKLGYDVLSIAHLVNEADKNVDAFYEKIGIKSFYELSELKSYFVSLGNATEIG